MTEQEQLFADRYKMVSTLGSGGMGVVYRALDTVLNREVAVKTLRGGPLNSEQFLRFQSEAKALSALKHPNIVEVLVLGLTDDNLPYLVMDFVEGKSLATLIDARGYIPAYKSVNIFIALCDGMAHVHRNGVLHRDLKPANIMLQDPESLHPRPIVVDFGIARIENVEQSLTKPGSIIGTPVYMSPELLKGRPADARSDIYSLGCIMYETLTGRRPFDGNSELEMLSRKLEDLPPRLDQSGIDIDFSEVLEAIVAKSLATDPDRRYQSMDELKEALAALKAGDSTELTIPARQRKKTGTQKIRKRQQIPKKSLWSATAIGALLLAASGFIVSGWMKPQESISLANKETFTDADKNLAKGLEKENTQFTVNRTVYGDVVTVEAPISSEETDESILKGIQERQANNIFSIDLIYQPITGSMFWQLKNQPIQVMTLRTTNVNEDGFKAISKIRSLKQLRIDETPGLNKEGLAHLSDLPNLTQITLSRSDIKLEHLKAISGCKHLMWIDISGNRDVNKECLEYIVKTFPNLDGLDLSRTGVTSADYAVLAPVKKMIQLRLSRSNLCDDDLDKIPNLPNLSTLYIDANPQITDAGFLRLLRFKKLEFVALMRTRITPVAVEKFKLQRPGCNLKASHGRANARDMLEEEGIMQEGIK